MLTLRKVAVTGGLSCGKSSVCRFFEELGSYVVNADEIVHQLLTPSTDIGQQVINLLGSDIIVNRKIERRIIANKVFNNHALLLSLEKLLHPAVFCEIETQYQQVKIKQKVPLFIAEIPLLFEVNGQDNFDLIIDVWSDPEICLKHFIAKTGCDAKEYEKRMSRQLSPNEKAKRADVIINNTGSLHDLRAAVINLFNKLAHGT
ncbi:MAG: dephospho-CoA kinase [Parachlamydiaceae bacterium]|nr:dephospho-CoA kinase [Parachlamydiaceae bacterium]